LPEFDLTDGLQPKCFQFFTQVWLKLFSFAQM